MHFFFLISELLWGLGTISLYLPSLFLVQELNSPSWPSGRMCFTHPSPNLKFLTAAIIMGVHIHFYDYFAVLLNFYTAVSNLGLFMGSWSKMEGQDLRAQILTCQLRGVSQMHYHVHLHHSWIPGAGHMDVCWPPTLAVRWNRQAG